MSSEKGLARVYSTNHHFQSKCEWNSGHRKTKIGFEVLKKIRAVANCFRVPKLQTDRRKSIWALRKAWQEIQVIMLSEPQHQHPLEIFTKIKEQSTYDHQEFLQSAGSVLKRFLTTFSESFMLRWSTQLLLNSEIEQFLYKPLGIIGDTKPNQTNQLKAPAVPNRSIFYNSQGFGQKVVVLRA